MANGVHRSQASAAKRRVLNLRFLILSTAIVTVLGFSAYLVHRWQLYRTATALLQRASELEQTEDWLQAAEYVHRYLQLVPGANNERLRLAQDFERGARNAAQRARAVDLYYQALGIGGLREASIRVSVGKLLLESGRHAEAELQADEILRAEPSDPQGLSLRAKARWAEYSLGSYASRGTDQAQIIKTLSLAHDANPDDLQLGVMLASAYRDKELALREVFDTSEQERSRLADESLNRIVRERPNDPDALLARFAYRKKWSLPGASDDLQRALSSSPNNVDVLLVAAEDARLQSQQARVAGRPGQAEQHLEKARDFYLRILNEDLAPDDPRPSLLLGDTLTALGKTEESIVVWEAGLAKAKPEAIDVQLDFCSRLANAQIEEKNFKKADELLNSIDSFIAKLTPLASRNAMLPVQIGQDFRRGVLTFRRGDIKQSVPYLEQAVQRQKQFGGTSEVSLRASLILGSAYSALGEWQHAIEAFDQAAIEQPAMAYPRVAGATACLSIQDVQGAVERAEQGVQLESSGQAWFTLATSLFRQQILLAPHDRVWKRLDSAVAKAVALADDKTLPEPWRVPLLQVDCLLARSKEGQNSPSPNEAVAKLLSQAEVDYPTTVELWRMLPLFYQSIGRSEDADRVCKHIAQLPGGAPGLPILQARVLILRKEYDRAEELLTKALDNPGETDHVALARELINVKIARRDLEGVRPLLIQMVRDVPSDITSLRRLAEIELAAGNTKSVQDCESKLARIGGEGRAFALYFQVLRLLMAADSPKAPAIIEARQAHANLISLRPTWAEAVTVGGLIDERQEDPDSAIIAYERAIALGEQRLFVYERLIGLLEGASRNIEAEKYLSRMREQIPLSQSLTMLESTIDLRRNELDEAIGAARRGVASRPEDAAARLWLGRMLFEKKLLPEAEIEFAKAIEIAPSDGRAWMGLVEFYVSTGQPKRAREKLTELAKSMAVNATAKNLIIAQGFELLGEREEAANYYSQAVQAAPQDAQVLLRVAAFYRQTDIDEAVDHARKAFALDHQPTAKRLLAALLTERSRDEDWAEAQRLLDDAPGEVATLGQDNRFRAALLARRGGAENLARAVLILEELVAREDPSSDADRMMLASLYEHQARISVNPEEVKHCLEQAQVQFAFFCNRSPSRPNDLLAMIEFLLRHDFQSQARDWSKKLDTLLSESDQPQLKFVALFARVCLELNDEINAEKWIKVLEKETPGVLPIITLRARLLEKMGKSAEVTPFVEAAAVQLIEKVESDEERIVVYQEIGNLYSNLGKHAAAETWYRKLSTALPQSFEPLADALVKQGRIREALELFQEQMSNPDTARPALVMLSIIMTVSLDADARTEVNRLLGTALRMHPRDGQLLTAAANWQVVQNQTGDAIKLYRRAIQINPRDPVALNNLATLLAETPDGRKEALQLIDRAIEIVGSEAGLLDTKGTILVFDGQSQQAVEVLKIATREPNSDPRFQFHLALAYHNLKAEAQAKAELQSALERDLEKQVLTTTERQLLSDLRTQLAL